MAWRWGQVGLSIFTRYRRNRMMKVLLGIARFPSPNTIRRFFLSFNYRRVTEVCEQLIRFSLKQTRPILLGHTLDLDSTVFCRYRGEARGEFEGLQSKKAGTPQSPSVGGVFKRGEKSAVGGTAFGQ